MAADLNKLMDDQMAVQSTEQANIEFDRLMLRLYQDQSLMSYLNDVAQDGTTIVLDFLELPAAVIEQVTHLIGPVNIEVLSFAKELKRHTAFRFDIKPLADLAVEYNNGKGPAAK